MEIELAPCDMFLCFIQVKGFVTWLGFHQHSSMDRLILVHLIGIGTGIANIDFAKENTAPLKRTEGTAGNTELRDIVAMLKTTGYSLSVIYSTTFIIAIEQSEATIPKCFDDRADHALERAAWDN